MKFKVSRLRKQPGIALFIVITSLIILSLAMRELVIGSSGQVERIRNSLDRIQATYLARSTLQLAHVMIYLDMRLTQLSQPKVEGAAPVTGDSDTPNDLFLNSVPFPVPVELVRSVSASAEGKETKADPEAEKTLIKQCNDFYADFPGTAVATIKDMTGRINVNAIQSDTTEAPVIGKALANLILRTPDRTDRLARRGINPNAITDLLRELRDYIDVDTVENSTNQSELYPYSNESLEYGPKNGEMVVLDELKLLPHMDDELFQDLNPFVAALPFNDGRKTSTINLNTVSPEVFQSFLTQVARPEDVAKEFEKDRKENNRIYVDKNIKELLKDNLGLEPKINYPEKLFTGIASYFLVEISSRVNDVDIRWQALVRKPSGNKLDRQSIVLQRASP